MADALDPGRLILPALRAGPGGTFAHEAGAIAEALDLGVGGFIIFGGNAESVRRLTADLLRRAERPVLLASDLERGAGQQVEGLTEFPPPLALAAMGYPGVARWARAVTAQAAFGDLPIAQALAKRGFDIALSGIGLLLSLPVWVLAAVAIKLEDAGPVFYRQPRVGLGGRVFQVLKFRSMIPDAEARVGALQATDGDARITRVGRWMRATAADELPQLISIFVGDMSFVGPRALRPGEIEVSAGGEHMKLEDVPGFAMRCQVRPGLTGVAQIYAPRDLPRRHKFRYDRVYIRRQSFGLDVRLVAVSFWITFRGAWEVRGKKF